MLSLTVNLAKRGQQESGDGPFDGLRVRLLYGGAVVGPGLARCALSGEQKSLLQRQVELDPEFLEAGVFDPRGGLHH